MSPCVSIVGVCPLCMHENMFGCVQWCHGGDSAHSKPRFNDFSYTAESSSCLYRIMSSSRPKSTLADGGLLAGEFVKALLNDIIGDESVTVMT
mmetsp:Transcript_6325/g.10705  ORF Transcript_6325/g.10705 Transcript_6325/m.10705 type:complete len:93 (+) Transcript_6325:653-931(+)